MHLNHQETCSHGLAKLHDLAWRRLRAKLCDNQSKPSYNPSPVVAHVDWMNHCLLHKLFKPSFCEISAAFIASGKSCLLANTKTAASRISSSLIILKSSSCASSMRSRSLLSTTKIAASVPW